MSSSALISGWNQIPWEILPHSAKVDIFLLIIGVKPAVRIYLEKNQSFLNIFRDAFFDYKVLYHSKALYISKSHDYNQYVAEIDNLSIPHEQQLGIALGYPLCCSCNIREIGENNIDQYEKEFVRDCTSLDLLDISLYGIGIALISHVPCKMSCVPSLNIARNSLSCLKESTGSICFSAWKNRVINYFDDGLLC